MDIKITVEPTPGLPIESVGEAALSSSGLVELLFN